jgi:hypothetical protein
MDWINRDDVRTLLRDASAARVAGAVDKDYRRWRRDMTEYI